MTHDIADLYDTDFYTWTQQQAGALRRAARDRLNTAEPIDWEHLAEEIEDMGKARARELRSRYIVLLQHLLKWRFQPAQRSSSWRATIVEARQELEDLIDENPGLKPQQAERFAWAYPRAVERAASDTGLTSAHFPAACPFTLTEALDQEFWPD
jgi:hypothetical protein